MFETQKFGKKTSSGVIDLNIRTHASPKLEQDQVSGGVSVLCWYAASVANVLRSIIRFKVEFGNNVEIRNMVKNRYNVLSMAGDSVYGYPPLCVTFGRGGSRIV